MGSTLLLGTLIVLLTLTKTDQTDVHFKNPCPKIHQDLIFLSAPYNEMSASKAAANLLKLKQSIFDQGKKAGKILAWRLKQLQVKRSVTNLKNEKGEFIMELVTINDKFRDFYEKLYSPEVDGVLADKSSLALFDSLSFHKLEECERSALGASLTVEEILAAIKCMNSVKAASLDGLPIDIYKKFE